MRLLLALPWAFRVASAGSFPPDFLLLLLLHAPTSAAGRCRVFKLMDEKDNARERRRKVFEYFNTAITRQNK